MIVRPPGDQADAPVHQRLGQHLGIGKYGFLVFEGMAPDNIRKGQWPVGSSPLTVTLVDGFIAHRLEPAPALVPVVV